MNRTLALGSYIFFIASLMLSLALPTFSLELTPEQKERAKVLKAEYLKKKAERDAKGASSTNPGGTKTPSGTKIPSKTKIPPTDQEIQEALNIIKAENPERAAKAEETLKTHPFVVNNPERQLQYLNKVREEIKEDKYLEDIVAKRKERNREKWEKRTPEEQQEFIRIYGQKEVDEYLNPKVIKPGTQRLQAAIQEFLNQQSTATQQKDGATPTAPPSANDGKAKIDPEDHLNVGYEAKPTTAELGITYRIEPYSSISALSSETIHFNLKDLKPNLAQTLTISTNANSGDSKIFVSDSNSGNLVKSTRDGEAHRIRFNVSTEGSRQFTPTPDGTQIIDKIPLGTQKHTFTFNLISEDVEKAPPGAYSGHVTFTIVSQ
ncbi:MAG: hypothetical protein J0G29_06185 [Alphaproteobacteria bacterium]|nr:hypothetical protein [Alphaproteobacteria bacterium]OJV46953.1 MAG: hypothetical protein BGO28_06395 [Alphaproteobacteria bacterium 43-37]